jgi:hypothetical protein
MNRQQPAAPLDHPPALRAHSGPRVRLRPAWLLLALAIAGAPHAALAAICTATGNGSWNVPATWSGCGGGVPGAADTAVINAGSTVTIPAGVDVSVAAIEFGPTGSTYGIVVNGALTVGDVAHFGNQVEGSGAITVTGTYDWAGVNNGPIVGTQVNGQSPLLRFAPGSTWNISGTLARLIQRNVVLEGTLNFTVAGMGCSSNVTWLIASGATFNMSQEGSIGSGGANCLIRNEGTVRKSGAGTFRFTDSRVRLENHGLLEVTAGTFDFDAGGGPLAHSGVFRVNAGATLGMPRGGATYSPAATFEGAGTVRFAGFATNTFQGDVDFDGLVQLANGGSTVAAGAGVTLDLRAGMEWTAGIVAGPGTFRIPPGRVLTISSAGVKTIAGQAQVHLEGTTRWQGGTIQMPAASVPPQSRVVNAAGATFEVLFRPATFSMSGGNNNPEFENLGVFTATANADAGPLTLSGSLQGSVTNAGIMALAGDVVSQTRFWRQVAGQLILDDVRMQLSGESFDRPMTLEGGVVTGTAVFTGAVRNTGALILPGGPDAVGAIGVTGRYEEQAGAIIELDVAGAAPDAHDRFVVTGTPGRIDLRGDIEVNRLGGYQFAATDAVTLVDAVTAPATSVPAGVGLDPGFAPVPQVRLDRSRVVLALDRLFADDLELPVPALPTPDTVFAAAQE